MSNKPSLNAHADYQEPQCFSCVYPDSPNSQDQPQSGNSNVQLPIYCSNCQPKTHSGETLGEPYFSVLDSPSSIPDGKLDQDLQKDSRLPAQERLDVSGETLNKSKEELPIYHIALDKNSDQDFQTKFRLFSQGRPGVSGETLKKLEVGLPSYIIILDENSDRDFQKDLVSAQGRPGFSEKPLKKPEDELLNRHIILDENSDGDFQKELGLSAQGRPGVSEKPLKKPDDELLNHHIILDKNSDRDFQKELGLSAQGKLGVSEKPLKKPEDELLNRHIILDENSVRDFQKELGLSAQERPGISQQPPNKSDKKHLQNKEEDEFRKRLEEDLGKLPLLDSPVDGKSYKGLPKDLRLSSQKKPGISGETLKKSDEKLLRKKEGKGLREKKEEELREKHGAKKIHFHLSKLKKSVLNRWTRSVPCKNFKNHYSNNYVNELAMGCGSESILNQLNSEEPYSKNFISDFSEYKQFQELVKETVKDSKRRLALIKKKEDQLKQNKGIYYKEDSNVEDATKIKPCTVNLGIDSKLGPKSVYRTIIFPKEVTKEFKERACTKVYYHNNKHYVFVPQDVDRACMEAISKINQYSVELNHTSRSLSPDSVRKLFEPVTEKEEEILNDRRTSCEKVFSACDSINMPQMEVLVNKRTSLNADSENTSLGPDRRGERSMSERGEEISPHSRDENMENISRSADSMSRTSSSISKERCLKSKTNFKRKETRHTARIYYTNDEYVVVNKKNFDVQLYKDAVEKIKNIRVLLQKADSPNKLQQKRKNGLNYSLPFSQENLGAHSSKMSSSSSLTELNYEKGFDVGQKRRKSTANGYYVLVPIVGKQCYSYFMKAVQNSCNVAFDSNIKGFKIEENRFCPYSESMILDQSTHQDVLAKNYNRNGPHENHSDTGPNSSNSVAVDQSTHQDILYENSNENRPDENHSNKELNSPDSVAVDQTTHQDVLSKHSNKNGPNESHSNTELNFPNSIAIDQSTDKEVLSKNSKENGPDEIHSNTEPYSPNSVAVDQSTHQDVLSNNSNANGPDESHSNTEPYFPNSIAVDQSNHHYVLYKHSHKNGPDERHSNNEPNSPNSIDIDQSIHQNFLSKNSNNNGPDYISSHSNIETNSPNSIVVDHSTRQEVLSENSIEYDSDCISSHLSTEPNFPNSVSDQDSPSSSASDSSFCFRHTVNCVLNSDLSDGENTDFTDVDMQHDESVDSTDIFTRDRDSVDSTDIFIRDRDSVDSTDIFIRDDDSVDSTDIFMPVDTSRHFTDIDMSDDEILDSTDQNLPLTLNVSSSATTQAISTNESLPLDCYRTCIQSTNLLKLPLSHLQSTCELTSQESNRSSIDGPSQIRETQRGQNGEGATATQYSSSQETCPLLQNSLEARPHSSQLNSSQDLFPSLELSQEHFKESQDSLTLIKTVKKQDDKMTNGDCNGTNSDIDFDDSSSCTEIDGPCGVR